MAETRYFVNLINSHINLPLQEPERSEALEYFNFVDFGKTEFCRLLRKSYEFPESFTENDQCRLTELSVLNQKYACSKKYKYWLETTEDGHDDYLIQRCFYSLKDEDSFKLNETQRKITIDLIELSILNLEYIKLNQLMHQHIRSILSPQKVKKLIPEDFEKMIKWRYLKMKYGRQERLAAKKRRIDAACLGPGFSIDW